MALPVSKTKLPNESLLALPGCMGCGPAQMLTSIAFNTPFLRVRRNKINRTLQQDTLGTPDNDTPPQRQKKA